MKLGWNKLYPARALSSREITWSGCEEENPANHQHNINMRRRIISHHLIA
jgi:hypothetical protein